MTTLFGFGLLKIPITFGPTSKFYLISSKGNKIQNILVFVVWTEKIQKLSVEQLCGQFWPLFVLAHVLTYNIVKNGSTMVNVNFSKYLSFKAVIFLKKLKYFSKKGG
jgi:hypothetical protein